MKSANRNNGKKVNLNKNPRGGVKFSRLSPAITQCCLVGAFGLFPWLSRLFGDGMTVNHNEMFLADRS
jgi:hypothetical protein